MTEKPWYKWLLMLLFASVCFLMSVTQFQPGFFAQDIMDEFGLTTSEFTWMTAFPMMVGLFLSFVMGSITDRIGIKRTLLITMVITTAGAIYRAFCYEYILLLISSSLIGLSATVTAVAMAKIAMAWFPDRQVSLAVGIMASLGAAGMAFAQAFTGVLYSDFRTAFFWGGIMLLVVLVLWAVFARDRAVEPSESDEPEQRGSFKDAIKCRGVWIAGLGNAFYNGFNVIAGSLLITALVVNWGTDPVFAGFLTALFTIGIVVGNAIIPATLARMKLAKLLCIAMPIAAMGIFFLGWCIDSDVARCILFPVAGFFFGGIAPTFIQFPSVLPEIDTANAGAAGGLMTTIQMVGAVVFPTFVITPIAGTDYNLMVIISCCFGLVCSIMFALLPSVYRPKK